MCKHKAEALLRDGLAMVPEGRGIFARMTVLENLQMGAWLRRDTVTVKHGMAEIFARFPRLGERQHQPPDCFPAVSNSYWLNRALLSRPRLLILDEPSMGLAPKMVENIFTVIAGLVNAALPCCSLNKMHVWR
jgi:branched-chain amino acid transport system ATP-binding protein